MPEDVHLLLSEPQQDTLADALKLRRLAGPFDDLLAFGRPGQAKD
jgi:hypothetical protein